MSRKKINLYIVTGICICFLVCFWGSYNLTKQYVAKDFENTIDNLVVDFEKKYGMKDNNGIGDSYFEASPEAIMGEFSKEADHGYPWQAVFTTGDGSIVTRSGSWMYFYDRTNHGNINFDEYLTKEHWEKLDEFWGNIEYPTYISYPVGREYVGYGLDYNIENGNIVPVQLTLLELEKPEHTITLQFSEGKAQFHCSGNMVDYPVEKDEMELISNVEYYFPIVDESIPNKAAAYMRVHFVDVENGGQKRDTYQLISRYLNEDKIWNEYELELTHNSKYCDGEKYIYEGNLQISGKYYTMYLMAGYSEVHEILHSRIFLNALIIQGGLLMILGTALFIIANYLYKKNEKLDTSHQIFTSAVAHDLKTPVAIIKNQCECILEDIAPEKNKTYVRTVYNEAAKMDRMIMTFLQYNRLQITKYIEKQAYNLQEIVCEELQKYEDLIDAAGLILETNLENHVIAKVNKELIAVVIGNYLSNAYKYTEAGRIVKVTLCQIGEKGYFEVFNEGASINSNYENEIWDVLIRQDKARDRKTGSSGMGLPICKKILELHNFDYGYENMENGLKFWFRTE